MAERFYVNYSLGPGPVTLDGPEAHHLAAVCRLRPGAVVCLFNGDGREYLAQVQTVGRREVALEVTSVAQPEREVGFRLEVAAPLPKGDRASFLVEKLTELGVTAFIPLDTARSVVHPREAKLDRLQRQVIEASKQCGRNVLLEVRSLVLWTDWCRSRELPGRKVLAHPSARQVSSEDRPSGDVVLAVGPEGGFTDEEVDLAREHGWEVRALGPRILRVETAALALAVLFGAPRGG